MDVKNLWWSATPEAQLYDPCRRVKCLTAHLFPVRSFLTFVTFKIHPSLSFRPLAIHSQMSNALDITVEQAREIVRVEAIRKGWVRPELSLSNNPETVEVLETLRHTRESLGDTVNVYNTPRPCLRASC
jgi:hypothetical protein